MMQQSEMRRLFDATKTIAIVGAKDKPEQPVNAVGRYLIEAGFDVIPVNPGKDTVWGLKAYATLSEVPVPIDIVDVFRAPEYCAGHAREAAALAALPKVFWMQLGIADSEANRIARDAGMLVIENHCIKIEHHRLFG